MSEKVKGLTVTVELSEESRAEIEGIKRQIAEVADTKVREFARMLYLWQFGSDEDVETCSVCPCRRQCNVSNKCEFPDYATAKARELSLIGA